MKHEPIRLPELPNELVPYISDETIEYHHGKHHKAYAEKLDELIKGTGYEDMGLEAIILSSSGDIFDNAAQVYNHDFYFKGLDFQNAGSELSSPSTNLVRVIEREFESFDNFKKTFISEAKGLFGSGWVWLTLDNSGTPKIENYSNAGNPLSSGHIPLLACDVWEHSYYIDYRDNREEYLENWWKAIDWGFVSQNLESFLELRKGHMDPVISGDVEFAEPVDTVQREERADT